MYTRALRASPLLEACLPGLRANLESAAAGCPLSCADHAEGLPGSTTAQGQTTPFAWDLLLSWASTVCPLPELHLLLWCSRACASSWALSIQPTCGLISWPGLSLSWCPCLAIPGLCPTLVPLTGPALLTSLGYCCLCYHAQLLAHLLLWSSQPPLLHDCLTLCFLSNIHEGI